MSQRSRRSSGSDRTAASPRSAAQGFADHLNDLLNRTVTDGRLSLVPVPTAATHFLLQRMVGKRSSALVLRPSPLRLFVRQGIEVVDGHCETASYIYRLQAGDDPNEWLVRWEYFRRPPRPDYPYVLQHLHVNAELSLSSARPPKELRHLHMPTARVALESVLQHLIVEWGVRARKNWKDVVEASRSGFYERASRP